MSKIIGITSYNYTTANGYATSAVDSNYVDRILALGFTPLIIPTNNYDLNLLDLCSRLDGLVLSGGSDITPIINDNASFTDVTGVTDYVRDTIELNLLLLAIDMGLPILGICRGLQLFCISEGIKVEDISSTEHSFDIRLQSNKHHILHVDGENLKRIFNTDNIIVNSYHHQGVKSVSVPSEYTDVLLYNGVLEFLKCDKKKFLGTQWHPEMGIQDSTSDIIFGLFKNLVLMC